MRKILEKFNTALGFTPTETKVVLFLIAMFVIGIAVKSFQGERGIIKYDYRSTDSVFAARSKAAEIRTDTGEETARVPSANRRNRLSAPIDINTAGKDELVGLPGIGESLAERIIQYREENGQFQSLEELMNVKGIGRKKFDQLLPYCRLGK